MILRALHRTVYHYAYPARASHNEVRLMPLTDEWQTCLSFKLRVEPVATVFSYSTVGGVVHYFGHQAPHDFLEIIAESTVETRLSNPFETLNFVASDMSVYANPETRQMQAEFLNASPYSPVGARFKEYASEAWNTDEPLAVNMIRLKQKLFADFKYVPGASDISWGADDVLEQKSGVCQDLAHLTISCFRSLGIPARYVSGYLYSSHSDGLRGDQATHAWAEIMLPDGRWIGLDPTNNVLANDHHIRVHVGRDYSEVTPTKGVYIGGSSSDLKVSVGVEKLESIQDVDAGNMFQSQSTRNSDEGLSQSQGFSGPGGNRQSMNSPMRPMPNQSRPATIVEQQQQQ